MGVSGFIFGSTILFHQIYTWEEIQGKEIKGTEINLVKNKETGCIETFESTNPD